MVRPIWAPDELDIERPSAARVYDHYLGGAHNFASDRAMAQKAVELWPELPRLIQENRAFCAGPSTFWPNSASASSWTSVRVFRPWAMSTVVHARDPDARVVCVDIDPVAVLHSRAMLAGNQHPGVIQADLRIPGEILEHPEVIRLIDFAQPVAVLMVAVLHFVSDEDDPEGIVARYRDAVSPGSYLILSHAYIDGHDDQAVQHQHLYRRTATPMTMRSRARIANLFDGWSLVEPEVTLFPAWRPDPGTLPDRLEIIAGYAGVARKP